MFMEITSFLSSGGPVMYVLAILGMGILFLGIRQVIWLLIWKYSRKSYSCSGAPYWSARAHSIASTGKAFKGLSLLESIELCLNRAEDCLTRSVPTMRFLSQTSTLLGFLGTVTGMVRVFNTVAQRGTVTPTDLAGGIYEALFTTVFGLILAITGWGFSQVIESLARQHLREFERMVINELETSQ